MPDKRGPRGVRNRRDWAVVKNIASPPVVHTDYPEHDRAKGTYGQWLSGFTEEEIAKFHGTDVAEIERDVQHIQSTLTQRMVITHNNDRNRILIQRQQAESYQRLLGEALEVPAQQYVAAGITPAGPMKEYREAVGMTERPGGIALHVSTEVNVQNAGLSSSEDVLRTVMKKMKAEQEPIDIESQEVQDDPDGAPAGQQDEEGDQE